MGTSLNSGNEWGSNDDEQTCVACLFSDVHKPGLLAELPITTILGHCFCARMTTRNVNTARKLAALCVRMGSASGRWSV